MHASTYASSHVRYRECDVKEPNDEKLELQMWLVDLISWNQKPVPTQIQLLLLLCSVSQCNFNFCSYPQQIFSTLYISWRPHIFLLVSDFRFAVSTRAFLLSVVFYILHVIRSCIVRFLIGSKFPPSSFLFLPNSVSSSIGLFTTVKMFPTSLSYMRT